MRFPVKVVPRAKQPGVAPGIDGTLVIKVREPAEDGRANDAVIAGHFKVKPRLVTIVHGHASRRKLVEVNLS